MSLPTCFPSAFSAGTTVKYRRLLRAYLAGDGWEFQLLLRRGPDSVAVDGTPDGDAFLVVLAASDTADLTPGTWAWVERVSKGGEVYDPSGGRVVLSANPEKTAALPWEEEQLAAVRAKIKTRISQDLAGYTVLQRAAHREELAELRALERDLVIRVAAGLNNGLRPPVRVAFTRP